MRNIYKNLVGKTKMGNLGGKVYHNIKFIPEETGWKDVEWIHLA